MFTWLWNFICGYVIISVEGLSLEKFLNLAMQGNVKIWDVRRTAYTSLTARVTRGGFKRLRRVMRGIRCRVHIEHKWGMPFELGFLRFRRVLLVGAFVFAAALAAAGMFLMDVRVEGAQTVPDEKIIEIARENGAKRFTLRRELDLMRISAAVIASDRRIAWAGTRLEGTRLIIEVVESAGEPRMIDKDTPADIIALKDAVIKELTVLEGMPKTAENALVRAGDVLISGRVVSEGAEHIPPRLVHARGQAIARVWYKATARIGEKRIVMLPTGRQQETVLVSIAGWEIVLSGKEKYRMYETQPQAHRRLSSLYIPVDYVKELRLEVEEAQEPLDLEDMKLFARNMAYEKLMEQLPETAIIIDISSKYTMLDGALLCELFAETQEQIGAVKPLGGVDEPMAEDIDTLP